MIGFDKLFAGFGYSIYVSIFYNIYENRNLYGCRALSGRYEFGENKQNNCSGGTGKELQHGK